MNKLFRKFLLSNFIHTLWWRFVPGTTITVKWPSGWAVLADDSNGSITSVESADPNDHYRTALEKSVGIQGWDWNWGCEDDDVTNNTITIKIRQAHAAQATYFQLLWS